MSVLFDRVFQEYRKIIVKSNAIRNIRKLIIVHSILILMAYITVLLPPEKQLLPFLVCLVFLLYFLIYLNIYRNSGLPTDISAELQRHQALKIILENFSYIAKRADSSSSVSVNLNNSVDLDGLISDCDSFLSNRINIIDIVVIAITALNCIISGKSLSSWVTLLINEPTINIVYIIRIVILSMWIIYMIVSMVNGLQSLCFPTKKNIVIAMRRDLLRLKFLAIKHEADNSKAND